MTGRPILTAEAMRAAEAAAIAAATPVGTLMERAGEALAEAVFQYAGSKPVLVACGPGNNGGDGYVAAHHLQARGVPVRVAALAPPVSEAGNWARGQWGGVVEDYQPIHDWFDESKMIVADFRHRALRHHAEGIFMAETIFGTTITLSTGRLIPVRWIGEQHVREDLGFIPSFADWVKAIRPEPWMGRAQRLEDSLAAASIAA